MNRSNHSSLRLFTSVLLLDLEPRACGFSNYINRSLNLSDPQQSAIVEIHYLPFAKFKAVPAPLTRL